MEFRVLKYFLMAAREENITKAAALLHITQPTLSRQLMQLEKERIERGILDMGLLTEPVDITKYEFIRMPQKEQWGILTRRDSELAGKEYINPEDLTGVPLLMVKRELIKNELSSWFGDCYEQLQIAAVYNLIINAAAMVKSGIGAALCFDLGTIYYDDLCFIPLHPALKTGSVLVWKKNQTMGEAAAHFIRSIKNAF